MVCKVSIYLWIHEGNNLFVMKGLSSEGLPATDHQFTYQRSIASVSGMITHHHRTTMEQTSWVHCDETYFLYAWLTCNKTENQHVVIVNSRVAAISASQQQHLLKVKSGVQLSHEVQLEYLSNMKELVKYFDSMLDLFEQKFIVYEYYVENYHWQSLVDVNARHVLHPDHATQDEVTGFFMLDSMSPPGKERKAKGLKDGSTDDYNVQMGLSTS